MLISNLLLIPGTGDTASEIFRALRYEKTVRLYASSHGETHTEPEHTPHRMTPIRQLPFIADTNFPGALQNALEQASIDYIVPTTAEARTFFKHHTNSLPVLDTQITREQPSPQDAEVRIDCYSDKQHHLVYVAARKRMETQNKTDTVWQTVALSPEQKVFAAACAQKNGLTGAWSFTPATRTTPEIVIPYFIPEMGLHRALGVNFLLLMLHEARGNQIKALPINACAKWSENTKGISVKLEYQTVFLDLDDTLIVQGTINDTVVAFIYRCQAKNTPVYLITRHYRDPAITLCEFGIAEKLFEDIIWIQDKMPKSSFMKDKEAPLFLDDAFSERLAVSSETDIPCLPPEAVEALMVSL